MAPAYMLRQKTEGMGIYLNLIFTKFPNGQTLLHFAAYEDYERKSSNKLHDFSCYLE